MDKPNRDSYTPTNFLEWREADVLVISPKFQRRGVWKLPQKSYLIDTLLRQMPVPPIYLRNIYKPEAKKVVREVIDGQQRIRAVVDYVDGKYALSKSLSSPFAQKRFSALPQAQQTEIMKYRFICETFDDISDPEVLEVFARLNMYSVPLNRQELRNGKYFGQFKQTCYQLAHGHLEMWRKWKMFTEGKIARMAEVQLTSAMLIAQLDGMQDKNDSIDAFYGEYDETFPKSSLHEKRFRATMDEIMMTFDESLVESQFRKAPFFYTLFCTVYHRLFGLPKVRFKTPKKKLSQSEREDLREATGRLSDIISKARRQQQLSRSQDPQDEQRSKRITIPVKYRDFAAACLSQTDNVAPRSKRLETLHREAFS